MMRGTTRCHPSNPRSWSLARPARRGGSSWQTSTVTLAMSVSVSPAANRLISKKCGPPAKTLFISIWTTRRRSRAALAGVDRLFLLTGYTVDMLVQSKTLVDAAKKAGVRHIVHQGIFGQWDCTDPHFAWHQMIEKYIEASGIAWTHLHPNVFMDNLLTFFAPRGGTATVFFGEQRVGWIALKDLAAVAAAVLRQGPQRHGGQDYWLSPEVLTGPQVADILSDVLGTKISVRDAIPGRFGEDARGKRGDGKEVCRGRRRVHAAGERRTHGLHRHRAGRWAIRDRAAFHHVA